MLERLQRQAEAAGGALYVLNGNHETMNVAGNYRYATAGEGAGRASATTSSGSISAVAALATERNSWGLLMLQTASSGSLPKVL